MSTHETNKNKWHVIFQYEKNNVKAKLKFSLMK